EKDDASSARPRFGIAFRQIRKTAPGSRAGGTLTHKNGNATKASASGNLFGFFFWRRRGSRFTPTAFFRAFSSGSFVRNNLFVSFPFPLARFTCGRFLWRGRRCGAFDANFQGRDGFGMQAQFNVVLAQGPNRMFEVNFSFVERDVKLRLVLVGNRAGGNGTEHFSVVAGLDDDDRDQF